MNGIYIITWFHIKKDKTKTFLGVYDQKGFISRKDAETYAKKTVKKYKGLDYDVGFVFISDRFNLAYYL